VLRKVIVILFLFLCLYAKAQRFPFYNLNVENGLIQSQATSLVQDKSGHLWIGTLGGLSRYDGKNFTNYTVRNGMLNNTVTAMAIDNTDNIWIGTPKGISKYNGKKFRHYVFQSPERPGINSVSKIVISKDNKAWCIAGNKLYSITNDNIKQIGLPDSGIIATSILCDNNEIWVGNNNGVIYHYHNEKWDNIAFNEPTLPFKPAVLNIFKDSRQRIWAGTNAGLFRIINNKVNVATLRKIPLYGPSMFSICEDKQGSIWLGTASGAYKMTDSSIVSCRKDNGLTDNAINELLTDKEGNVWMASFGQGVFRFSGSQFYVVGDGPNTPNAQIMSIGYMRGKIYFGTYDAGLYVFSAGKMTAVPMPANAASGINTIQVVNNELWLGTRASGLLRYNGSSFTTVKSNALSGSISFMYTDPKNRVWIGQNNGVAVYEHDSFRRIQMPQLSIESIISIGTDSTLFATTSDGLKLYTAGDVYQFKTNAAPDSASTQCLTLKGDELWLGTSDNGLICYNLKTKKSFVINKANGLQSDFIYNVIADDEGNIWAGTGYGIHKLYKRGNTYAVKFYGKEHGISGMESNQNAVLKMPDSGIWFGTTNGAVHYNPHPQSKAIAPNPISIALQSVKLFGDNITDSSYYDSLGSWYNVPYALHLPYRKNNITFTFQGITLSGSEQLKYRYRIEGLENNWSDWSTVNTVTYSALPPGKYTLAIQCITGDSSNVKDLTYPFEIVTPFHKTKWFMLLILGGCILLGVTIQYIVNKRKQNRLTLMERLRREEQVKVRERTAEDFHDEIGNKLTRINVLTNVLKNKIGDIAPDTKRIIDQIQDNTGQLYGGTRDILWSLKPSNDSLYEILHRIRDFGGELFQDTEIDFEFTGTDERWKDYKLPLDSSRNLIMIFKEALNNCLKYAGATVVTCKAELKEDDVLHLELKDNGRGFNMDSVQRGHGIDNMNVRAKRLNGRLYIDAHEGAGTIISLSFKLPMS
jgi:ligand-binding sensor domain-containing protein/signal transduction histidine kinase